MPNQEEAPPMSRMAVAITDVNWFTSEHLFRELGSLAIPNLLLRCEDWRNAWMRGVPPWRWRIGIRPQDEHTWRGEAILPSGWMKKFPTIGMRPIAGLIRRWRRAAASGPLTLIATYPHYLFLERLVRPDRMIYLNMDDYTMYWPGQAEEVRRVEREMIERADLSVCVSNFRTENLRAEIPAHAEKIRHLPHGSPVLIDPHATQAPAIPAALARLPRPWLGFAGWLEDRVDWKLLSHLARAFPGGSLLLVGKIQPDKGTDWERDRAACLALPNVHAVGWKSQEEIAAYNQSFDVALIPYLAAHPFNQQCSPTKIMDVMGTGRPTVSTDLPECKLYSHLFDVVGTPEEFVEAARRLIRDGDGDRPAVRRAYAAEHSCRKQLERLLSWLPG